jgi:putative transposase
MDELEADRSLTEITPETSGTEQEHFLLEELSPELRLKVELIGAIASAPDRETEKQRIQVAVKKLKKCERTIRNYRDAFLVDGAAALVRTERSDKGSARHISQPWRDLVLELYKRGQKHSRRRNRNQLWLLIQGMTRKLDPQALKDPARLQVLIDWYAQKLGASDESKQSKLNKILGAIRKELEAGIFKPPKSHVAVYNIVKDYIEQQNQKLRHPGQGKEQFVQTTDGIIYFNQTNEVFQADHTPSDILLVDQDGNEIGSPYVTTVMECTSGCIAGFYLGFRQPSSHEVALALRHAILPKTYAPEYGIKHPWICRGVPKYLVTDRAKEFKSQHLRQIASELGIELRLRAYPSQGGLIESGFDQFNKELISTLPGYKGSNIQKRPEDAEKYACITIEEYEREFIRYLCNRYNWNLYPRIQDQPRIVRWEDKLFEPPNVPDERRLDLCLLKRKKSAKVQKFGTVQFASEIYEGDCLSGYKKISLRYDPGNIMYILAYTEEKDDTPSKFLGVLKIRERKEEKLSLKSLELEQRLNHDKGRSYDMSSVFDDVLDRNEFVENKLKKEKRQQKRAKEHERAGCSDGLSNVIEFKRQEVEEKNMAKPQVQAEQPPAKRLQPKHSAKVAAANWNQHLDENW